MREQNRFNRPTRQLKRLRHLLQLKRRIPPHSRFIQNRIGVDRPNTLEAFLIAVDR